MNKLELKQVKALKRDKLLKDIIRDKTLHIMLLIVMIFFIVFKYVPLFGNVIAFKDYKIGLGIINSPWVGLKHFKQLFSGEEFFRILYNTLFLSIANMIFCFPMPILVSILLNEVNSTKFKKAVQSVLYIPHFISWAVVGGIIVSLLSPSTGVVNIIIQKFGGETIFFMGDDNWWRVVFVISTIWKTTGWSTIVYLAAITAIDVQLYEAARVDGANKLKQMRYITLPALKPTILTMLILNVGNIINVGFDQVYALRNDMVFNVAEVIATYEYRVGIQNMQYSYTTALGLFKSVVAFVLVFSTNYISKRMSDEESGLW